MISRLALSIRGWKLEGERPAEKKFVLIVAPHTSNWDFPIGMFAARVFGLDVHYLGKHTLFEGPFGWFFRMLGGIPVRRDRASNLSQQMAEHFENADELILAIAPEGTRSLTEHWKMGFWHIANEAQVPNAMSSLDYSTRTIQLGGLFMPSGDIEADLARIRDFYEGKTGR